MGEGLSGMGKEGELLADNPLLLFDDDWKMRMAIYLAAIQVGAENIQSISVVPYSMGHIHGDMNHAAELYMDAVEVYVRALDNVDADLALEVEVIMGNANTFLGDATHKIDTFCDAPGPGKP